MAEKKSFVLYFNAWEQWSMLTDEQAGILIKALLNYGKTGEKLETQDGMVKMAFAFISAQMDMDREKYDETCRKRKEAVRKRWEKDTDEYNSIQMDTNDTDNDNVNENDNVNDNGNGNDNVNDNERSAQTTTTINSFPSLEEITAYCTKRKSSVDPERFMDYYTANGWIVGNKPICDWKAVVRMWERSQHKKAPEFDMSDPMNEGMM